jgi:hypothetical protein
MAATAPGSVSARCKPFGLSAVIAAGMPGIRANIAVRRFPPIGPRACCHDPQDVFATRRCPCGRDMGAPAAARNDVSRVALADARQTRLAAYFGDRPGVIATPAATRANRPAPPLLQPRRDA